MKPIAYEISQSARNALNQLKKITLKSTSHNSIPKLSAVTVKKNLNSNRSKNIKLIAMKSHNLACIVICLLILMTMQNM